MNAFALLRPHTAHVVAVDEWGKLFRDGSLIRLTGGMELHENGREDGFFTFKISDVYYPPISVKFTGREKDTLLTPIAVGSGRSTGSVMKSCLHNEHDVNCLTCFAKDWRLRAEKAGIKISRIVMREPE